MKKKLRIPGGFEHLTRKENGTAPLVTSPAAHPGISTHFTLSHTRSEGNQETIHASRKIFSSSSIRHENLHDTYTDVLLYVSMYCIVLYAAVSG